MLELEGTSCAQAANPSGTVIVPLAFLPRLSEISLECDPSVLVSTVKLAELVAVPPGVVTEIVPVTAPVGTVTVIWVGESTVKLPPPTPLKVTAVAPVRLVSVIVTELPGAPVVGANELIVGGAAESCDPAAAPARRRPRLRRCRSRALRPRQSSCRRSRWGSAGTRPRWCRPT